jgi:hypothetical protein
MPQRPSSLSLTLCDQVVFEQGTQKPYLLRRSGEDEIATRRVRVYQRGG